MGSKSSKQPKKIHLEAIRVQTLCIQIKVYLQGYRRDIQTQIDNRERELLRQLYQQIQPRHQQCEIQQLSKIIELMLYNIASDAVIRKAEVLKDQATRIERSNGQLAAVKDLESFIQNICWANLAFKLSCIEQFQNEFLGFFGEPLIQSLQSFANLDNKIKMAIAPAITASFEDLNGYVNSFCRKFSIDIQQFNGGIHQFMPDNQMQQQYSPNNNSMNQFDQNSAMQSQPLLPSNERFLNQQISLQQNGQEQQQFVPQNHYANAYLLASRTGTDKSRNAAVDNEPKSKLGLCC